MKGSIVIAIPVELKSLVEPLKGLVASVEAQMRSAHGGHRVDYAEFEQRIAETTAGVERAAHESVLRSLEVDASHVEIKGKKYSRVGRASGTYYTMAGSVTVERALYRENGRRNASVVDAISLRAGIIGRGWLPRTAQAMAHLLQQGTSREAATTAEQIGRLPYSRASFDRVPHELGELWMQERADIEDRLVKELEIPADACSVSMSLDRVSLPMEEPATRPIGRPRKNAPKRPVTRQFRMAYCGTLTLHDAEGRSLHTIRYGCMPGGDQITLCSGMADDLLRLLEKRPDLEVVLLLDGAPELWNLLEEWLSEQCADATRLIDFWHLLEKLAPAAKAIFGEQAGREAHRRWRKALLKRSSAASEILAELQQSGREWSWLDSKQPVHNAITYIENNLDRMNYAAARRKHLPIGSGNVEATCKTLVATRMKRSGSRWKNDTGEHILQFRALALSDRWTSAMTMLHATRRTAVRCVA